eukprot:11187508-Lingulodinium_polyedra.AAC.1
MDRMPLHMLNSPEEHEELVLYSEDALPDEVELAIYPPMTTTVECGGQAKDNDMVLLQMGKSVRQTVVQRDDDVLTPEQLKTHWREVRQAILKELQAWAKL